MEELANGVLYHGDCLEVMHEIPDGSVDMILADLPYGTTQNKWDIVIDFEPLWEHYERVIKQNGAIVLTAAEPFTSFLVVSNHKLFRYDLVWDKVSTTGFLNANKMPMRSHENILVFYKFLPIYNPQKSPRQKRYKRKLRDAPRKGEQAEQKGCYGGFRRDKQGNLDIDFVHPKTIITAASNGGWAKRSEIHATQKPVALFEYLIKTYTEEGNTVLDNVIGSGTTGVAAFRTGRKWIGIEKDAEIFEKCRERIAQDTRQQPMFAV